MPRSSPRIVRSLLAVAAVCGLSATAATAQTSTDAVYRTPAQVLVDIVDAPPTPGSILDPQKKWMLLTYQPNLPPITELAERELRLGGLRIKPQINGPSRTNNFIRLELLRLDDLSSRPIAGLPEAPRIENIRWAPDGTRFAFTNTVTDGIELWVAEAATATARRLLDGRLNQITRLGPQWAADGKSLLAAVVPEGRGAEPQTATAPTGPVLQENLGRTTPARTYQDLLKSEADERLFAHYTTSQLVRVGLDGTVTRLGAPGIHWGLAASPDGRYLLVQTLHEPFSYLVPADRFPRRVEIWDAAGNRVRQLADLPLQDQIPITFGSVAAGPRNYNWRDDAPATLAWAEALDGGDAGKEAAERDRVFTLPAPFDGTPAPLVTLAYRFAGGLWGNDKLALVDEFWWKTRRTRTWIVRPDGSAQPEILFDRSFEDRYSDPGFPELTQNQWGRWVLLTARGGKALFLSGEGASAEGDRPFVDLLDLTTKKTERLFHSQPPYFEQPRAVLDKEGTLLLVTREAVETQPNFFVRDLKKGTWRQITRFPHPSPQLKGLQKELIRYERADGVKLTGTLYLPPGYKKEDGPLPIVLWVYPQEFKSADAAGQVTDSPYRFDRVGWWSPLLFLTQGYAVLDNPTLPIVGEGDVEPNDSYVQQLVAGAKAAIDEVVRRGVADPRRTAIGGHSYGAFTTANLLAHSDLFAAGIAQSGAYNRTLTPFGFQSEERDLWQAPKTYIEMSPFMNADKINEPILVVHGQADNNAGTDPIQSERFYAALKGKGATVRLVMLPLESHGYRARESVLHLLWETTGWLETWVKKRPGEQAASRP